MVVTMTEGDKQNTSGRGEGVRGGAAVQTSPDVLVEADEFMSIPEASVAVLAAEAAPETHHPSAGGGGLV